MDQLVSMNAKHDGIKTPRRSFLICKRVFDIVFSLFLLLLLSPLLLVVLVIAAIDTKGSPFFLQERAGRYGKPFKMIKFRTMSKDAPQNVATHKLDNPDQYISKFGGFLRKLSIDELPQLVNILIGDMSFVGPRPVVLTETDLLELRVLHGAEEVRPGMTGLAQIRGRDELPLVKKAFLDGYYARHACVKVDLQIAWQTVIYVLRHKGIHEGTDADVTADPEIKRTAS